MSAQHIILSDLFGGFWKKVEGMRGMRDGRSNKNMLAEIPGWRNGYSRLVRGIKKYDKRFEKFKEENQWKWTRKNEKLCHFKREVERIRTGGTRRKTENSSGV